MAQRYTLQIGARAGRQLADLPLDIRRRIDAKILALADNPRPPGSKKLAGPGDQYRIRVGDYRVVYEVHDKLLLVVVLKVDHRSNVYRRMRKGRAR